MTDHHAEAERWLREAETIFDEPRDYNDPPIDQIRIISRALLGIGYALLANLSSNRPYDYEVTMDDPAWDRCHWWTDSDGWAFTGQTHWPGRRRCALYANHDGDHQDPQPSRRPHEPPTPMDTDRTHPARNT